MKMGEKERERRKINQDHKNLFHPSTNQLINSEKEKKKKI